tara:strand:- start:9 stop:539 length:531 start_codon:yes stop_codon:yes gene_type:complete
MLKLYKLFIFLFFNFLLSGDVVESNEKIPNVKLKSLDNKKFELLEVCKDSYVLFNFWNMSCEPCKKEMKFLNEFHEQYSDFGFKVVSINIDQPRSMAKVKKYVKSSKYSFEVFQDPSQQVFKKMGGSIMPFVVIADNKNVIINKHIGYNPGDEKALKEEIETLISFEKDTVINEAK